MNMDDQSLNVVRFLTFLTEACSALRHMALTLHRDPRVDSATSLLDCVPSRESVIRNQEYHQIAQLELSFSAELKNGYGLFWNVEVSWDTDGWHIDASIRKYDDFGESTLRRVLDSQPQTFDQLLEELQYCVVELTTSTELYVEQLYHATS